MLRLFRFRFEFLRKEVVMDLLRIENIRVFTSGRKFLEIFRTSRLVVSKCHLMQEARKEILGKTAITR